MRHLPRFVVNKMKSISASVVDDAQRTDLLFVWFNALLSLISGCMSVVNIFTAKWVLCGSTLLFCVACVLNLWLSRHGTVCRMVSRYLFLSEGLIFCGFFCISGMPEGFSALWSCFIPSFAFTLLGMKRGGLYSGIGFAMIGLIFWTPFGRSLLQYDYTESFLLRFPMIYLAFVVMSLFLEYVRMETQRQLTESEKRYQHLYKHDALTGVYNRYGFNEQLNEAFAKESGELTLIILDLDDFKSINDTYGHDVGDVVLRFTADTLCGLVGQTNPVCRWGGEEFTVMLQGASSPEKMAERIRREMEDAIIHADNYCIQVTVSMGVCTVRDRKQVPIARFVRTADQCLYQAKNGGKNRIVSERLE